MNNNLLVIIPCAGIGNRFRTPNIIDKNAVIDQKVTQLQSDGKIFPIAIKPPSPL